MCKPNSLKISVGQLTLITHSFSREIKLQLRTNTILKYFKFLSYINLLYFQPPNSSHILPTQLQIPSLPFSPKINKKIGKTFKN